MLIGDVLDVTSREVRPDPAKGQTWAAFTVRTVHVLTGRSVQQVQLAGFDRNGQDLFRGEVPPIGDQVALQVSVDVFPTKDGKAGFRFTGWENVSAQIRMAAPAKA